MDGLAVGRIVHYVMEDGLHKGEVRPAIIVKVWDGSQNGCCQLQVFTDGTNDGERYASGVTWKTSRVYDADGGPGTWHWPVRA